MVTKRGIWIARASLLVLSCVASLGSCRPVPDECLNQVRIASWNIRMFRSDNRTDEELGTIAEVLSQFDLVVIQEVFDLAVLDSILRQLESLGQSYDVLVSPVVDSSTRGERFAFLYRTDTVVPLGRASPCPDPGGLFIIRPFAASFRAGAFDFTLIAVHLIGLSERHSDKIAQIEAQIEALADVFAEVQDVSAAEQDVLLIGDFNRIPYHESFQGLRGRGVVPLLDCGPGKCKCKLWATTIEDRYQVPLDNMWFQPAHVRELCGKGVDRFDEMLFGNDDQLAMGVSDHRPVWATFHTCIDDD